MTKDVCAWLVCLGMVLYQGLFSLVISTRVELSSMAGWQSNYNLHLRGSWKGYGLSSACDLKDQTGAGNHSQSYMKMESTVDNLNTGYSQVSTSRRGCGTGNPGSQDGGGIYQVEVRINEDCHNYWYIYGMGLNTVPSTVPGGEGYSRGWKGVTRIRGTVNTVTIQIQWRMILEDDEGGKNNGVINYKGVFQQLVSIGDEEPDPGGEGLLIYSKYKGEDPPGQWGPSWLCSGKKHTYWIE